MGEWAPRWLATKVNLKQTTRVTYEILLRKHVLLARNPHRATPSTSYTSLPKATPTGDRGDDTHDRVRRDKIDNGGVVTLRVNGRLHHIGIGRTHARTHVILLVQDLQVRVVDAATGELLRELTIDPTRGYQPTRRPPGPSRHQK